MRTLILEIEDDAYQQVFNFMKLVPKCRVLDWFDDETDDKEIRYFDEIKKMKLKMFVLNR